MIVAIAVWPVVHLGSSCMHLYVMKKQPSDPSLLFSHMMLHISQSVIHCVMRIKRSAFYDSENDMLCFTCSNWCSARKLSIECLTLCWSQHDKA